MEDGEKFNGMSSNNEYWNSSSDTYSDDSSNSLLSSIKEYRDVCCSADFCDDFVEIIDEHESDVEKIPTKSGQLTPSPIEKIARSKSARYVRWDVLMSLGIGLWAILCIVDLLHPEDSVTKGERRTPICRSYLFFFFFFILVWLYESMRGKKNVSKIESIKRPTHVFGFTNLSPYLWRIVSISGSTCAYILLFLLLIIFCADPRLRKSDNSTVAKNDFNGEISAAKTPVIVKKSTSPQKTSRIVEPAVPRVVPVKLESSPAIYVHAKILSNTEGRVVRNFTKFETAEPRNIHFDARNELSNVPKILHAGCQTEYRYQFAVNKSLFTRLDIAGYGTFKFTNINRPQRHSIASMFPTNSGCETIAVRTFHLKIEEYTRTRKICNNDVDDETFPNSRDIEPSRVSTESLSTDRVNTRIITSSPAFKTFLSQLTPNKVPVLAIAAPKIAFRNNLQNISL